MVRQNLLGLAILASAFVFAGVNSERSFGQGRSSQAQEGNRGDNSLGDLRFRNLGPAVAGGRVSAVAGVPGNPNVFYAGAAGGGVWKTTDGGITWRALWENMPTSSIGAIALAPQNPNWVWVATGEANPRNDVITGRGIFFSSDGGSTWRDVGLHDAGQIDNVIVSPADASTVYASVLGHVWGANADRGIFRTTDGGATWKKVLFINDTTGASDLVMDPSNPKVLYAGMWQYTRKPWRLDSGGEASGIYRTSDGGDTWQKLSGGLPTGLVGRIGIAIAASNPEHLYALVESRSGVVWESRDGGNRWAKVSDDRSLQARPFYFSHLYVAPDNEERVYFLSYDILLSTDGARTAHIIARGVHPDHHVLWIDPRDPAHMLEGNDGGIYVSADAADHWRYLDNLPIEQLYSVALDDRVPYTICGGLQDNNGWCGPSNSLKGGGIGPADWSVYVGGDGQYVVPGKGGVPFVYADSQGGAIVRTNRDTEESAQIRPYNMGAGDQELSKLKYRFNWTSPIAVSPKDSNEVYLGGNVLFRSKDAGAHWTPISPDLTRNDPAKLTLTGGPILLDLSSAENYDTILSMSISAVEPNVIWVGTDDGLVQVTRDGGAHWSNVSSGMSGIGEWGRISQIDASPFAAGTAYASVDFHETENNKPYVFRTDDFGKSWTSITRNLPDDAPVHVVREDPNRKGLLVAGTDTGLFYSIDGGDWRPLRAGFPTVPVFDVQFNAKTDDLVVATHGRGFFVLDGIGPLEHVAEASGDSLQVFPIANVTRWRGGRGGGFSMGAFTAPNPAAGAVISFYVPAGARAAGGERPNAEITISASSGRTAVRKLRVPVHPGINRAVWPLTYDPPTPLNFIAQSEAPSGGEEGGGGGGRGGGAAPVAPGTYIAAVTVNGQTQTQQFQVMADPRSKVDATVFVAQTKAALEAREAISTLDAMVNRIELMRSQIRALARPQSENSAVADRARDLDQKLSAIEQPLYNPAALTDSKSYLHWLSTLHDRLTRTAGAMTANYSEPPSQMALDELTELRGELEKGIAAFNQFLANDAAAFNKFAAEQGVQAVSTGKPMEMK